MDGGLSAEGDLPAAVVVGAFDQGDGGNAQLLAGGAGAPVQEVVLQLSEEGLHRGAIADTPTGRAPIPTNSPATNTQQPGAAPRSPAPTIGYVYVGGAHRNFPVVLRDVPHLRVIQT